MRGLTLSLAIQRRLPGTIGDSRVTGDAAVIQAHLEREDGIRGDERIQLGRCLQIRRRAQGGQDVAAECRQIVLGNMELDPARQDLRQKRSRARRVLWRTAPRMLLVQQIHPVARHERVERFGRLQAVSAIGSKLQARMDHRITRLHTKRARCSARPVRAIVRLKRDRCAVEQVEHLDQVDCGHRQLFDLGSAPRLLILPARKEQRPLARGDTRYEFQQLPGALRERLGRMRERQVLAIGHRGAAVPRIHERGDVHDDIRGASAAHAQLDAPGLLARRIDAVAGRQDGGQQLDGSGCAARRASEFRSRAPCPGHEASRLLVQQTDDLRTRRHLSRTTGCGSGGFAPKARRVGGTDPVAGKIVEHEGDLMLAHAVIVLSRRTGAGVVEHIPRVRIELDIGAVALPMGALDTAGQRNRRPKRSGHQLELANRTAFCQLQPPAVRRRQRSLRTQTLDNAIGIHGTPPSGSIPTNYTRPRGHAPGQGRAAARVQ